MSKIKKNIFNLKKKGMMVDHVLKKKETMLVDEVKSKIKTLQNEADFMIFLEKNHGSFFVFFPDEVKTLSVCKKALQYSGNAIASIDLKKFEPLERKALCILAIENAKSIESMLHHISSEYIDDQVQKCIEQKLSQQPRFQLKHVPEYMMTYILCEFAVEKIARNILNVPKQFQSQNMWFKAIKVDPLLIHALPLPWINQAICNTAQKLDPRSVYLIPKEYLGR